VVSPHVFHYHSPKDYSCWESFHMLNYHLYIGIHVLLYFALFYFSYIEDCTNLDNLVCNKSVADSFLMPLAHFMSLYCIFFFSHFIIRILRSNNPFFIIHSFTCAYIVWVIFSCCSPLSPSPCLLPSLLGRTCSALISNFIEEKT
jgi:hypothetical protein